MTGRPLDAFAFSARITNDFTHKGSQQMTNDEINRKVAKIEELENGCEEFGMPIPDYCSNWTWCGPLIEKYRIKIHLHDGCGGDWDANAKAGLYLHWTNEDTPQRAICLAVIASQEK